MIEGKYDKVLTAWLKSLQRPQFLELKNAFIQAPPQGGFETLKSILGPSLTKHLGLNVSSATVDDALRQLYGNMREESRGLMTWDDVYDVLTTVSAGHLRQISSYHRDPVVQRWRYEEINRIKWARGLNRYIASTEERCVYLLTPYGQLDKTICTNSSSILNTHYIPSIKRLVTASADGRISSWEPERWSKTESFEVAHPVVSFFQPTREAVLFAGDTAGSMLTFSWDKEIRISNKVKVHDDYVMDFLSIPELNFLVSGSLDRCMKIWDIQTLTLKGENHADRGIRQMAYSKEYSIVFSCGFSREISCWNPFTKGCINKLQGHDKPIIGIHAVPDSAEFISADETGKIVVWDVRKNSIVQTFGGPEPSQRHSGAIHSLIVHDNKNIKTFGRNILTWRSKEGSSQVGFSTTLGQPISVILFNSLYNLILTSSGEDVYFWQVESGELQTIYTEVSDSEISAISLCNKERDLVVGNVDGSINFISLLNGQIYQSVVTLSADPIKSLQLAPNLFLPSKLIGDKRRADRELTGYLIAVNHTGLVTLCHTQFSKEVIPGAIGEEAKGVPGDDMVVTRFHSELSAVSTVSYSNEHALLALSHNSRCEIWHAGVQCLRHELATNSHIACTLHADTLNCFITAEVDGTICLWSTPTMYQLVAYKMANGFIPRLMDLNISGHVLGISSENVFKYLNIGTIIDRYLEKVHEKKLFKNKKSIIIARRYILLKAITGTSDEVDAWDPKLNAAVSLRWYSHAEEWRHDIDLLDKFKSPNVITVVSSSETGKPEIPFCIAHEAYLRTLREAIFQTWTQAQQKTDRDAVSQPEFNPEQVRKLVICLAEGLKTIHETDHVLCMIRNRYIYDVNGVWKIGDVMACIKTGQSVVWDHYPPHLCPPEVARVQLQVSKHISASPLIDMWALGLIVYELLTLNPYVDASYEDKHKGHTEIMEMLASSLRPNMNIPSLKLVDKVLLKVLAKTLEKEPECRWTANEVLEYLQNSGPRDDSWTHGTKNAFPRTDECLPTPLIMSEDQQGSSPTINIPVSGSITAFLSPPECPVFLVADYIPRLEKAYLKLYNMGGVSIGRLPQPKTWVTDWQFPLNKSPKKTFVTEIGRDGNKSYVLLSVNETEDGKKEEKPQDCINCSPCEKKKKESDQLSPFFSQVRSGACIQKRVVPFYMHHREKIETKANANPFQKRFPEVIVLGTNEDGSMRTLDPSRTFKKEKTRQPFLQTNEDTETKLKFLLQTPPPIKADKDSDLLNESPAQSKAKLGKVSKPPKKMNRNRKENIIADRNLVMKHPDQDVKRWVTLQAQAERNQIWTEPSTLGTILGMSTSNPNSPAARQGRQPPKPSTAPAATGKLSLPLV